MSKYDETLEIICHASRMKMTLNAHKGSIENLSPAKAEELLHEEVREMLAAIAAGDHEKAVVEAGDAINFLVALAYNCVHGYRERK